jgi:hypothetical protein
MELAAKHSIAVAASTIVRNDVRIGTNGLGPMRVQR